MIKILTSLLLIALILKITARNNINEYIGIKVDNKNYTYVILNKNTKDTVFKHYPFKSENKIEKFLKGNLSYEDNYCFNNNYYLLENYSIGFAENRFSIVKLTKYRVFNNEVIYSSELKIDKLIQKGAYTLIRSNFDNNYLTISYDVLTYPKAKYNNIDIIINLDSMKIVQQ